MVTPDGTFKARAMLHICTTDLPARAAVASMKQFNGEQACPTCLDSGDNTSTTSRMHRVWPFNDNMVLRTQNKVSSAFKKAVQHRKPVC